MSALRPTIILLLTILITTVSTLPADAAARRLRMPRYRSAKTVVTLPSSTMLFEEEEPEPEPLARTPEGILAAVDTVRTAMSWNPFRAPLTFTGYMVRPTERRYAFRPVFTAVYTDTFETDSLAVDSVAVAVEQPSEDVLRQPADRRLTDALEQSRAIQWLRHKYMIYNPATIEFASWMLPEPPEIPEDDISFEAYLRRLRLPTLSSTPGFLPKRHIDKIHWLHTFNGGIQFSQAYLSKNWYQGGNDYLALLVNFFWNVKLNQTYHPNLLFDNTISHKLGLNSTKDNVYHKYSISEDLFQWNMNFGVRARSKWFYSLTTQFKTQLLNNYASDSEERKAAFLSPGELNLGLGMTYSTANKKNTFKFKAAISPLSYNLKMCLDEKVDPTAYNIKAGEKTKNEIGSSGELTMEWALTSNISYRSRMFLFSDYKNFSGDWENTFSFAINRFLSTQLFAHLRYDSAGTRIGGWGRWMLKEILSFGFAYAFSTK